MPTIVLLYLAVTYGLVTVFLWLSWRSIVIPVVREVGVPLFWLFSPITFWLSWSYTPYTFHSQRIEMAGEQSSGYCREVLLFDFPVITP